jgi:hypothetical protein
MDFFEFDDLVFDFFLTPLAKVSDSSDAPARRTCFSTSPSVRLIAFQIGQLETL